MERGLTHRELQELLGAYALDAVDPDEAAAVEEHVASCPRCRAELAEHRETAAMLASVGAPAPEGVWDRIAAELDADAGIGVAEADAGAVVGGTVVGGAAAGGAGAGGAGVGGAAAGGAAAGGAGVGGAAVGGAGVGGRAVGRSRRRAARAARADSADAAGTAGPRVGGGSGDAGAGAGAGGAVAAGQPGTGIGVGSAGAADRAPDAADLAAARITDLAQARADAATIGAGRGGAASRRSRLWTSTRATAAAMTAAAVIVALLGIQLARVERRLDEVQSTTAARSLDEAALFAAANPDARRVRLSSDDGSRVADAVLLPDGQGYLLPRTLPALTEAETYQLWAVVGDQKISVGVLGPRPKVTAFHYNADPSVLAITAERAGGVVASEKQAVVVGFVEPKSA